MSTNLPVIHVAPSMMLPDTRDWINRFDVRSETSDNLYTIAQHRTRRHWGCSCPGWRRHRKCKHLAAIGVPPHERPYEALISS